MTPDGERRVIDALERIAKACDTLADVLDLAIPDTLQDGLALHVAIVNPVRTDVTLDGIVRTDDGRPV